MGRMSWRSILLVSVLAIAPLAFAQEQAFTNRATELRDRGAADAKVLASLPENTAVKVLARGGAWTRVEANGQPGWVNVFALRFPATVETSSASGGGSVLGGLTSIFGGGRQAEKPATLATTGIRGLSPEDLKNASPDNAALAKMQGYRADKPAAERFAHEGRLASVSVDDPQGGRR
ncbi:MAG TPA: SH3 domain-containing protein [Usitatibacter sp.]|jgi:hypothetical protein|nr:SH3 domain-containing protein [Usitatibacter sp.]